MRPVLICTAFVLVALMPAPRQAPLRFEAINVGLPAERIGATGSAWVDVDNDGFVDVAIAARDSFPSRVYRGSAGRLEAVALATDATAFANAIAWGDVDGDGDHDLVVAQNPLALYETRIENGRWTLERSRDAGVLTSTTPPRGAFEALAFADVDNDGDLDLSAATHGGGGSFLLLNDGRGRFTIAKRDVFPFASYMGGAHAVDLDNDRRLDLLFTGAPFPAFSVGTFAYWNGRTEWLADRAIAFSEHAGGLGSSVADVDGDGDLDVFVAGWQDATPSNLYLNTGGRRFVKSKVSFSPRVVGSAFADMDNDGDVDLVVSTGYSDIGRVELWINDGRGELTRVDAPGLTDVPGRYTGLAVVDWDRDGRMDVFVASRGDPPRVFRNATASDSQWIEVELRAASGGVPIWGSRVVLELTTPAGARRMYASIHQQSGYGGHGEPIAHFGVPLNTGIRRVQITWTDGQVTSMLAPAMARRHRIDAPPFVAIRR